MQDAKDKIMEGINPDGMPFFSIDIETGGLDPVGNSLLEFGAVFDRLGSTKPVEELPCFRAILIDTSGKYNVHPYLWTAMHRNLMDDISQFHQNHVRMIDAAAESEDSLVLYDSTGFNHDGQVMVYLESVALCDAFNEWATWLIGENQKINIAGKNFASFDLSFLDSVSQEVFFSDQVKYRRRIMDPANLFMTALDDAMPNMHECLRRAGIDRDVNHTSIGDARDVVRLLRDRFPA